MYLYNLTLNPATAITVRGACLIAAPDRVLG